ncbi:NAD(P)-dependent oxidoreductase [Cyanobium sp. NIES-981]|uniref:NAD(P)-dependent oxidoreductase n=1 Tax=Cyanobium sp. NIES-981 TaxID=1851505 RepID=UPI0007DDEFBD|nr:NAD(P)-dependent oxidoreductase [Cyanobium sp. NIES-981]SBO43905.1 3-hydroxyisobutyrate dehydrogenase [Cyanobium sp. NIES-981]
MRPESRPPRGADPPSGPLPRTAFLGLGALGAPMAANLLQAGFPLSLYNRSPGRDAAVAALAGSDPGGGSEPLEATSDPAAAVAGAEVVCLCLSDDRAVRAVVEAGVIDAMPRGGLVVDFSTIAPATSRHLAATLHARGLDYIDAPVTGGTEGARRGTLSVLVGGEAAAVARARRHLEVVGSRITHLGPVGAGQEAKAVNQVLVAGSYAAVAEAMALGSRLGLPMEQVVEALKAGAAGSWALEHRAQQMLENRYPLGFRLALHRKDLAIALQTAGAVQLTLPITSQVAALEDSLIAAGHGDEDVSALARWFRA